jgi:hypothetical protein
LLAAGALAAVIVAAHPVDLDAEENMAMTNEAYKAWLDAMPIDDVHHSIERLEHKLSDLRVLERLSAERQPGGELPPSEPAEAEASSEYAEPPSEPTGEGASPESGSEPT